MNKGLFRTLRPWLALWAAAERLCHKFYDDRKISNDATMTDCYRQTFASAPQNRNAQRALASNNPQGRSAGCAAARS